MKLFRENNKIKTLYHAKETASNRLLNYLSNHPYKMKLNVAESFIRRILNLSDVSYTHSIKFKIQNVLLENNYPQKIIDKLLSKVLYTYRNPNTRRNTNQNSLSIFGAISYIPKLTEKVTKTLKSGPQNLILGSRINNKLVSKFTKLKDKIPDIQKNDVIYQIPCECDVKYIGQTKRTLKTRITEHTNIIRKTNELKNSLNNNPNNGRAKMDLDAIVKTSGIAKHVVQTNHAIKFDETKILSIEANKKKRIFKENCFIWLNDNMNLKLDSEGLHSNYSNVMSIHKRNNSLRNT